MCGQIMEEKNQKYFQICNTSCSFVPNIVEQTFFMTISDIKDRLTIETVLRHYGIEVDKNGMAKCPFHKDKKPSFKVYRDTNTWCCFSGNCDAETGDVIDFIGLKEGFISRLSGAVVGCKEGKYRAILKAKELLGSGNGLQEGNQAVAGSLANPIGASPSLQSETQSNTQVNYSETFEKLRQNINRSNRAKKYLKERGLSLGLEVGYNSGTVFSKLKSCIVFPLKDAAGNIVSLYGRSVTGDPERRHFYLTDRQGLYPNYPSPETKKLILTESIIDAASLLQNPTITESHTVLALFGTMGLTTEHRKAINQLTQLEEIIFWMDGDEAGEQSVERYAKQLRETYDTNQQSSNPAW